MTRRERRAAERLKERRERLEQAAAFLGGAAAIVAIWLMMAIFCTI